MIGLGAVLLLGGILFYAFIALDVLALSSFHLGVRGGKIVSALCIILYFASLAGVFIGVRKLAMGDNNNNRYSSQPYNNNGDGDYPPQRQQRYSPPKQ